LPEFWAGHLPWFSAGHLPWFSADAGSLPGDLKTRNAHLARFTRLAHYIPGTQDEAARLMDEILTPIPIDLRNLRREKS
jgi:hypothetical protein